MQQVIKDFECLKGEEDLIEKELNLLASFYQKYFTREYSGIETFRTASDKYIDCTVYLWY